MKIKIFIAGPLPPPIGGSLIVFKKLVQHLAKNKQYNTVILNTRPRLKTNKGITTELFLAIRLFILATIGMTRSDCISFQASRKAFISMAPILQSLSLIFSKPIIFRIFGGGFEDEYTKHNKLFKSIFRLSLKSSNTILVQTKSLAKTLSSLQLKGVKWFPNSIPIEKAAEKHKTGPCKHFVFLGRLNENKGIHYLIEAFKTLPGFRLTLYGPIEDEKLNPKNINSNNIKYAGVADHNAIDETLSNFDALILPTFHPGEGYPGVILQAYNQGLPVIATNWMAIPEIVNDSTGILIKPHSITEIKEAALKLGRTPSLYQKMSENAINYSKQFSDSEVMKKFTNIVEQATAEATNRII